jgi:hypothetical protein
MGTLPVGFLARNSADTLSLFSVNSGFSCAAARRGGEAMRGVAGGGAARARARARRTTWPAAAARRAVSSAATHNLHAIVLRRNQRLQHAEVARKGRQDLRGGGKGRRG